MYVRRACLNHIETYTLYAREAQAMLRAQGLAQYVPAAHDVHADAVRARVEAGTLYAVWDESSALGFFSLEAKPSPWWPADGEPALYLAGIVVCPEARGRGVGDFILQWCVTEAGQRHCKSVRLDCHAGNPWLCSYYEARGFTLQGRVEQHPGYLGCLYQRPVAPLGGARDVTRPFR